MEKRYINILYLGIYYYLLRSRSHISYYGHLSCTIDTGTTYAALKWSVFYLVTEERFNPRDTPLPRDLTFFSKYATGSYYRHLYTHTSI